MIAALGVGAGFLLGAVLGPTDPISATTLISRTPAPDRLRTILEGESLVNDGVGLVAFAIALTAIQRGSFSVGDGLLKFVELSAGGIALGVVVGFAVERLRRRVHDAHVEIPISLITPYIAYLPAERLHVSGILATVACGVYLGWRSEGIFRPEVRLQSLVFWDILTFVLSSILFVLLGTQFRPVLANLGGYSAGTLLGDALLVLAVVVAVRLAWMFAIPHLVAVVGRSRAWAEVDPWPERLILGWSGMRGALSLAAALSIPTAVTHREEILFLTFTTILGSLVLLGVPLPWLLTSLGFSSTTQSEAEVEARRAAADAALRRLDELATEDWVTEEIDAPLRMYYESRLRRLDAGTGDEASGAGDYRRLRRELLAAERAELRRREQSGAIGSSAARLIRRQLDHEESGLRG
jgi:CPA1 family monovalent cation:H+ antiporter